MKRAALRLWLLLVVAPVPAAAQTDQNGGAVALGELIRSLGVTSRVLMIGAHPDDEDTGLIAWLARGHGVETAYLSLTRGDGGQNLIGNELGEALGVIRTEELLAARRIDGGHQFFTRAYDFGYSKSADETYRHWPKDSILRDVVTVVRAFKPHVIVSVFSGTPRDGHGHHQVAGLLAREAYDVAGDTVRMPRSINAQQLEPWTPLKFYRSARFQPDSATLRYNVGAYDPLLGRSYAEIAGESRSQHKSQGFGALERKGVVWGYLRREATRVNAEQSPRSEGSIFAGLDTSIRALRRETTDPRHRSRIDALDSAVAAVRRAPYWQDPSTAVAPLESVMHLAFFGGSRGVSGLVSRSPTGTAPQLLTPPPSLRAAYERLGQRAQRALQAATAVAVEAEAEREIVAIGDTVPVTIRVHNRGRVPVGVIPDLLVATCRHEQIERQPGDVVQAGLHDSATVVLPDSTRVWRTSLCAAPRGSPYWLEAGRVGDLFRATTQLLPEDAHDRTATVAFSFTTADGENNRIPLFDVESPIVRRFADPVRGEVRRPVAFVPPISVRLDQEIALAPAGVPIDRRVRVHLQSAARSAREVTVRLRLPAGVRPDSVVRRLTLPPGGTTTVSFRIRGRLEAGRHVLAAEATTAGETYGVGYTTIDYEHIRPQRIYRPAVTDIVATDVTIPPGLTVAYVRGVGDNVPPAIEQLGIPVTEISAAAIEGLDPVRTRVLVIGPRAYEANDTLRANADAVLGFARRGGTVVVQYGQHEMTEPGIMPFPITLERRADRVSEEDAPVRIVDPSSRLLTTPNRIADRDFQGWVQDRSLYMPRAFDPRYAAPLSIQDTGEPPNRGAILVTSLGRGTYVYTTLAFFRQLPAGVPGAARLFVNLLAAGHRAGAP